MKVINIANLIIQFPLQFGEIILDLVQHVDSVYIYMSCFPAYHFRRY
jgi:hypothetical protein